MSGTRQLTQKVFILNNQFIGKGTFAKVYKGYHVQKKKEIAIKKIKIRFNAEKEIQNLQEVSSSLNQKSPCLIQYYGYFSKEGNFYLMFELCQQGSLRNKMKSLEKIQEFNVPQIFLQIVKGLRFVHSKGYSTNNLGIMHRDLKLQNILVKQNGQIKIGDFGISKNYLKYNNHTKGMGSPATIAPQVLNGGQYKQSCDVWSAGLILYELLTNKPFFTQEEIYQCSNGKLDQVMEQKLSSPISLPQQFDPQWSTILNKMIVREPQNRSNFCELEEYCSYAFADLKLKLLPRKKNFQYETSNFNETIQIFNKQILSQQKLKTSQQHLKNAQSWIYYCRMKNRFILELLELLIKVQYNYMEKFYKYVLLFLSGMFFLRKNIEMIELMKKKRVKLPHKEVKLQQMSQKDLQSLQEMLKKQISILIQSNKAFQQTNLIKYFIPYLSKNSKIFNNKKINEIFNLVQTVKKNDSQQLKSSEYLIWFQEICKLDEIYISNQQLHELKQKQNNLIVYMHIRVLVNFDKVFLDDLFFSDYLYGKIQSFKEANKKNFLERVQELNER